MTNTPSSNVRLSVEEFAQFSPASLEPGIYEVRGQDDWPVGEALIVGLHDFPNEGTYPKLESVKYDVYEITCFLASCGYRVRVAMQVEHGTLYELVDALRAQASIGKESGPNDPGNNATFFIYLAGHGEIVEDKYRFITFEGKEIIGFPIIDMLEGIQNLFVCIDTCADLEPPKSGIVYRGHSRMNSTSLKHAAERKFLYDSIRKKNGKALISVSSDKRNLISSKSSSPFVKRLVGGLISKLLDVGLLQDRKLMLYSVHVADKYGSIESTEQDSALGFTILSAPLDFAVKSSVVRIRSSDLTSEERINKIQTIVKRAVLDLDRPDADMYRLLWFAEAVDGRKVDAIHQLASILQKSEDFYHSDSLDSSHSLTVPEWEFLRNMTWVKNGGTAPATYLIRQCRLRDAVKLLRHYLHEYHYPAVMPPNTMIRVTELIKEMYDIIVEIIGKKEDIHLIRANSDELTPYISEEDYTECIERVMRFLDQPIPADTYFHIYNLPKSVKITDEEMSLLRALYNLSLRLKNIQIEVDELKNVEIRQYTRMISSLNNQISNLQNEITHTHEKFTKELNEQRELANQAQKSLKKDMEERLQRAEEAKNALENDLREQLIRADDTKKSLEHTMEERLQRAEEAKNALENDLREQLIRADDAKKSLEHTMNEKIEANRKDMTTEKADEIESMKQKISDFEHNPVLAILRSFTVWFGELFLIFFLYIFINRIPFSPESRVYLATLIGGMFPVFCLGVYSLVQIAKYRPNPKPREFLVWMFVGGGYGMMVSILAVGVVGFSEPPTSIPDGFIPITNMLIAGGMLVGLLASLVKRTRLA